MNEHIDALQDAAPAHWIWSQRDEREVDRMAQFRLTFDWDGTGPIAWTGFADTLYTLWCNGAVIGVGPVAGVSAKPYLTRWDLSAHARLGRNVLALQVWSTAGDIACGDVCSLEGGVIGWLEAGDSIVPTGTAWQARDAWPGVSIGHHERMTVRRRTDNTISRRGMRHGSACCWRISATSRWIGCTRMRRTAPTIGSRPGWCMPFSTPAANTCA